MDHTCRSRSKYIDSIATKVNIVNFVKGSRMFKINKIMNIDHCSYAIDINLEYYFEE